MKKPNLLVLLGSGATMPSIPGVRQLTSILREFEYKGVLGKELPSYPFDLLAHECEQSKPIESVHANTSDEPINLNEMYSNLCKLRGQHEVFGIKANDNKFTLGLLHDLVLERGPRPDRQHVEVNFEDLLGIAEMFSQSSERKTFPQLFLNRLTKGLALPSFGFEYEQGCYAVLRAVSEACDRVESASKTLPLVQGLEQLAEHFRLFIFSLNYDDIPEHSSTLDYFTGYSEIYRGTGPVNGSSRFLPLHLYKGIDNLHRDNRHYHLQLHGSVLFGPDKDRSGVLSRFLNRELARESWNESLTYYKTQSGDIRPRLPMVTGYGKVDATLWEPLGTYMGVLRKLAMMTPTWLVIGYGGSDPHVNACLKSAMNQSVDVFHVDGFRHAVVIDYNDFQHDFQHDWNLDFDNRDPIGHALINKIITPWAAADIEDPNSYKYLKAGTMFQLKTFNRIAKRLSVSFDGTSWAMNSGIDLLIERLLRFQKDE